MADQGGLDERVLMDEAFDVFRHGGIVVVREVRRIAMISEILKKLGGVVDREVYGAYNCIDGTLQISSQCSASSESDLISSTL